MDYKLQYYDADGMRVVRASGEFDLSNAKALEAFIEAARAGSEHVIVIDFSETSYLDSTILSVLVRQKKSAGPFFQIAVPKDANLRRIFEITQLHTGLDIIENPSEAGVA